MGPPCTEGATVDVGKLQPAAIVAAAVTGLAVGNAFPASYPGMLVQAPLTAMLFVLFLTVDAGRMGDALRNSRFTLSAVTINFVFTPLFAFLLGSLFFGDVQDLRIGLLMLLVTPCTDWYLVFTKLGRGNVELGMSILPLNLVLQILLLPVFLSLFFGNSSGSDIPSLLVDTAAVITVPLVSSALVRSLFSGGRFVSSVSSRGDGLQLLFLCVAVMFMFASEGREVVSNAGLFVELFVPLLIFFAAIFVISRIVGAAARFDRRDTVALAFTTMARNSPLALAIAAGAFPDRPLICLALVIGPLIELPVLSVAAWVESRWVVHSEREESASVRRSRNINRWGNDEIRLCSHRYVPGET